MKRRNLALAILLAAGLSAQTVDRTKPPATPPIPGYKLPPVAEMKLPNGLQVVLVEDARFPLVTARLNFMAGTKFDPKDQPGLAEAVASLVTEGTKTRNARQLSEETDAIGGAIGAAPGADALTLSGSALSENLGKLLALMSDCAMNASFPADEIALYQQNRYQELLSQKSEPTYLAEEKMTETIYGSSPYAHIGPTEASIKKLDLKALAGFRDTYLVPTNATLILIGKLPARDAVNKLLSDNFGSWKEKAKPAAPKIETPAPKRQIILVDRPGSVQADIHVGRVAPVRTSQEFFPMSVGSYILGAGANSRMFRIIREKEGYAYDAHTEYSTERDAGSFKAVTQVRNEVIEPALKAVLAEMDRMGSERVPAEELTGIKNFMAGLYLLRLETQEGVANQLNAMNTLGLPKDYLETYVTRVRSVEPDKLQEIAKKYIAPGDSAIVVVGDASKIGEALKKFGTVTVTKASGPAQ
jgi:zinc protease